MTAIIGEWILTVKGCPVCFATPGITSVSGALLSDADWPDGVVLSPERLDYPQTGWAERMNPIDGDISVDPMRHRLSDHKGTLTGVTGQVNVLTYLATRDEEDLVSTELSATISATTLSMFCADPAAVDPFLPGPLWVEDECMLCDSVDLGTGEITITSRGYLGTVAAVHEVDDDQVYYPTIWAEFPWVFGRECLLWFAEQTGAVTFARVLRRDTVQRPQTEKGSPAFVLQAEHIWTKYQNYKLGQQRASTSLRGFQGNQVSILVRWDGQTGFAPSSNYYDLKVYNTLAECVQAQIYYANAELDQYRSGSINIGLTSATNQQQTRLMLTTTGLTSPRLQFRVGTRIVEGNGGGSSPIVTIASIEGLPKNLIELRTGAEQHFPITRTGLLRSNAAIGYSDNGYLTNVAFILRGQHPASEDAWIVIRPTVASPISDNDTDVNGPSYTGNAQIELKSGGTSSLNSELAGHVIESEVQLSQIAEITTDHWYYGLSHILGGQTEVYTAGGIDARDWSFEANDALVSSTAGALAKRFYTFDGSESLGDLLRNECIVNACGIAVRDAGKLRLVPFRQPTNNQTVVTIPEEYLSAEQLETHSVSKDGIVNAVSITAPGIEINPRDRVSQARFGQGRECKVELNHLYDLEALRGQPLQVASQMFSRVISLWGSPRRVEPICVPWSRYYKSVLLGTWIKYSSPALPDGQGNRGVTNRLGQVIGRTIDPANNTLWLEVLVLKPAYGYSPCARLSTSSSNTVTVATGYLPGGGDYAGSNLSGYAGTTNDGGAGWFQAGDVVQMIQRNSTTDDRSANLTIASVNTVTRVITFTGSLPGGWSTKITNGFVDLRYAKFADCTPQQQTNFAWIGSYTTNTINGTTTKSQRWAG